MDEVMRIAEKLDEIAQPYLGVKRYGGLRKSAGMWGYPDKVFGDRDVYIWNLIYETAFSSSSVAVFAYDPETRLCNVDLTVPPFMPEDAALRAFRRQVEGIPRERLQKSEEVLKTMTIGERMKNYKAKLEDMYEAGEIEFLLSKEREYRHE